jgi:hypothetical protein
MAGVKGKSGGAVFTITEKLLLFDHYLELHLTRKFEWGRHDCCTFIGGWLQVMTGRDYLAEHRPWRTARQATKKLKDLGGVPALLRNNLKQINPHMAQDGDFTVYQGTAHLFSGRHVVAVGLDGLIFTDRTVATEAWTCRHY